MRIKSAHVRTTLAGSLALAVGVGLAVFLVSAGAQDSVTGTPPVFSRPQKKPPADAPAASPKRPDIRVQSALVTTPVTAIDSAGEFVYDLSEEDFRVLDNGVSQRLERFAPAERAVAVVIVVQANRKVAALLEQVRPLGSVFSGLLLGPQGQVAVIAYDDRVHLLQDFTSDSDQLSTTLRGLTPQGFQSRLNDALARAVALLESRPNTERRIIVAFSDGFDGGSETQGKEVIRRATGSEVTIYGLGFNPVHALLAKRPELSPPGPLDTNVTRPLPPGTTPTPTASANVYDTPIPVVDIMVATGEIIRSTVASSLLESYAGYTGGAFYSHWKKKTVDDQLSRIASEIHSQYELAYVPDTLAQAGFHRIEVKVRRSGVKVRARAGYFYQPPTP
jgi:VWFA-related protein